jgi:tyrosyl-tRNA synthetase
VKKHFEKPEERVGQKLLAFKVVEIVHWTKEAELSREISEFMFGENIDRLEVIKNLTSEEIDTFVNAIWGFKYEKENLFETIVKSGLANSNSEARESVKSWAIFINEKKIDDFNFNVWENFINNKILFLRKGKKNFRVVYL